MLNKKELFLKINQQKGINPKKPKQVEEEKPEVEAEEEIEEDKDLDAGDELSVTKKLLNYLKKKGVSQSSSV